MKKYSWIAVTSFVLAILLSIWYFAFLSLKSSNLLFLWISSILIIILGFIGLNQIKKNKILKGKLFAWLGIILGFILIIYSFYFKVSRIF